MPSSELMIAFFAATLLFAYMPGPALLYTAAQTVARGRRGGWLAALGLHVGGYVHVLAAALGLALLFKAVPVLYVALKFAGAAYLIWLGVQMIVSKPRTVEPVPETKAKGPKTRLLAKRDGRGPEPQNGNLLPRVPAAIHGSGGKPANLVAAPDPGNDRQYRLFISRYPLRPCGGQDHADGPVVPCGWTDLAPHRRQRLDRPWREHRPRSELTRVALFHVPSDTTQRRVTARYLHHICQTVFAS